MFSPIIAGGAGICQGAVGVSGPFIATWAHAMGFAKETYVFATSLLFMSISVTSCSASALLARDQERIVQGYNIAGNDLYPARHAPDQARQSGYQPVDRRHHRTDGSKIGLGADGWWLILRGNTSPSSLHLSPQAGI